MCVLIQNGLKFKDIRNIPLILDFALSYRNCNIVLFFFFFCRKAWARILQKKDRIVEVSLLSIGLIFSLLVNYTHCQLIYLI